MKKKFWKFWPYVLVFGVLLAVMIIGSQREGADLGTKPVMSAIVDDNMTVSADQVSEAYIMANAAEAINFPATNAITNNFVTVSTQYELTGSSTGGSGVVTKPNIIDTSNMTRGIVKYVVKGGDTLAKIVAQFDGVTAQQIRWSNDMEDNTVRKGQILYIPQVGGVLYTVKKGDTLAGLAKKYQSNVDGIVAYNDLEISGLVVGQTIILPNGVLPEKERPEYTPPTSYPMSNSNYLIGDTAVYKNTRVVDSYLYVNDPSNTSVPGQCTWYVYYMRKQIGKPLPAYSALGNARDWWYASWSNRFSKGHLPRYGAVIVWTNMSWYGHVAIVMRVNSDGSIVIRDMNYGGVPYRVTEATIPANVAKTLNYIY